MSAKLGRTQVKILVLNTLRVWIWIQTSWLGPFSIQKPVEGEKNLKLQEQTNIGKLKKSVTCYSFIKEHDTIHLAVNQMCSAFQVFLGLEPRFDTATVCICSHAVFHHCN
ncbi:E3 ubiquitin-protein ligase MARCH6 [Platysternon megacephalum]|uniref:E3 ubiquitin-protein ligase MARCH6 n=1 Tax=Platysternon megacephalum TaxID=55544 RepID=A0A4D9ECQ3_9SAUR|nr:E3 ubiquitin-protein ligase MARCH6 [Platysternon megacephalum]